MQKVFLKPLTPAALSVLVWGLYLSVTGSTLVLIPAIILPLLGYPSTFDVWVRMTGLLTTVLGFYYIQAARHGMLPFFRWKIGGHAIGIFVMLSLYFGNIAPSPILLTALIDLGAALWTLSALRKENAVTF
jgi:hypothetical protein